MQASPAALGVGTLGRSKLGSCVKGGSRRLLHRVTGRCLWRRPRRQPNVFEGVLDHWHLQVGGDEFCLLPVELTVVTVGRWPTAGIGGRP